MGLTVSRTTAKKLAIRRRKWKILTFNRKSHHPTPALLKPSTLTHESQLLGDNFSFKELGNFH